MATSPRWYVRLPFWTALCLVIAWPSIAFSWQEYHRPAIVAGLALIIAMHALASGLSQFRRFLERPQVRATFRWMYAAALLAAAIFPVAFIIQFIAGGIASEMIEPSHLFDDDFYNDPTPSHSHTAVGTFTIVLFAATLNFAVMCTFGALMLGVLRAFARRRNPDLCANCKYDIRASRQFGRCPECNTAISEPLASYDCPRCNYNLRASRPFHHCPACGLATTQPRRPAPLNRSAAAPKKTGARR